MSQRNRIGYYLSVLARFVLAAGLFGLSAASARALTLTGSVDYKYLVSSTPVNTTTPTLLKIMFENNTSGTNLSLCAGSSADFNSGTCPYRLSSSGGPGFQFLALVDATVLNGKYLYVVRSVGIVVSKFTLTIE